VHGVKTGQPLSNVQPPIGSYRSSPLAETISKDKISFSASIGSSLVKSLIASVIVSAVLALTPYFAKTTDDSGEFSVAIQRQHMQQTRQDMRQLVAAYPLSLNLGNLATKQFDMRLTEVRNFHTDFSERELGGVSDSTRQIIQAIVNRYKSQGGNMPRLTVLVYVDAYSAAGEIAWDYGSTSQNMYQLWDRYTQLAHERGKSLSGKISGSLSDGSIVPSSKCQVQYFVHPFTVAPEKSDRVAQLIVEQGIRNEPSRQQRALLDLFVKANRESNHRLLQELREITEASKRMAVSIGVYGGAEPLGIPAYFVFIPIPWIKRRRKAEERRDKLQKPAEARTIKVKVRLDEFMKHNANLLKEKIKQEADELSTAKSETFEAYKKKSEELDAKLSSASDLNSFLQYSMEKARINEEINKLDIKTATQVAHYLNRKSSVQLDAQRYHLKRIFGENLEEIRMEETDKGKDKWKKLDKETEQFLAQLAEKSKKAEEAKMKSPLRDVILEYEKKFREIVSKYENAKKEGELEKIMEESNSVHDELRTKYSGEQADEIHRYLLPVFHECRSARKEALHRVIPGYKSKWQI